jgi:hypothetical protein
MKIVKYKKIGISKPFLFAASAYRWAANGKKSSLDFSINSMLDQFNHETFGTEKPDIKTNGYTYGKSVLDITVSAMFEDYSQGLFCKYELMETSPYMVRKIIKNWCATTFFPYR